MNVYTLQDLISHGKPYADLMRSIQSGRLVPVLGSGFTTGLPAKAGKVPNADELKKKLASILCTYGEWGVENQEEIEAQDLSMVSDCFIDVFKPNKEHDREDGRENFLAYVENFYSCVHDIPTYQREFLKCGWHYLYTLNYDNAVESVLTDYEVVIPYQKLNAKWLKDKPCIIKLHGDVHMLMRTGDLRYCILSKKQYLDTITNKVNHDLMNWLQDDYSSKDLLFIGCSLTSEYDFLFADGKKVSQLSNDSRQSSYYVYFDKKPKNEISVGTSMKLLSYGIENVLRITQDELDKFYYLIKTMCDEAHKLSCRDKLNEYSNYAFSSLPSVSVEKNISYLFDNSYLGVNSLKKSIVFPSFFIHRNAELDVLQRLKEGASICVLSGNRFSGKTYVLLGLMNSLQLQNEKVYLINGIGLTDQMLRNVWKNENCVFLFDSGTLTNRQLREVFYNHVREMKRKHIQIVYVVNRSDRNFVRIFSEIDNPAREDLYICPVETRLNCRERDQFNSHMKDLALTERKRNETFLDFAIRLEEESLKSYPSIMPNTNFLSTAYPEMVECIIVLAVNSTFDDDTANLLDIRDELTELCANAECAVQKDYLSFLETSWGTHSGVKFVSNSTYWLYRCLSNFARTDSYYKTIAQSIKNIIERYIGKFTRGDGTIDYDLFQTIKPYYYLDNLQKMFFCDAPSKGSLELPEIIYSHLKGILGKDYQFLHQTAKCKLRLSRRCKNPEKRLMILDQAKLILDRAYGLAQQSTGANVEYTLAHMNVTKTLILTNFLRYCNSTFETTMRQLHMTISCYYYIYIEKAKYVGDINCSLESDELMDVKWFIDCFMEQSNPLRIHLTDKIERQQIEEVIRAYYCKRITIQWN